MYEAFKKKGWFWHWGLKMYKYRWLVTFFWVLLFFVSIIFAQKLPDKLKDSGLNPKGSESDYGLTLMQKELGASASTVNIVYTSRRLDLTSNQEKKRILQSLDTLKKEKYVESIHINPTPRRKANKGIQSVIVELKLKSSDALNHFSEIKMLIVPLDGIKTYVDGEIATLYDIQRATKQDMSHSEKIGLPVALIVLLFIFGTVWGAILPLIIGIISVSLTLGITYYLTEFYSLSNFLPNIVTMLGLAIGIDYALFLVSRFREELKSRRSIEEAVATTMETAGKSVFFSGFTVLIGLFGLLFIKLPIIYSLCLGGVLVILFAVTLSSTLLPALLGIFGKYINSLKVFPSLQKKFENSSHWEQIAKSVMKHPALLAILISAMLLSLMFPITRMKIGVPTADVLPPAFESRMGSEILKDNYDKRESNPILIMVKIKKDYTELSSIKSILSFEDKIRKESGVKEVRSYIDFLGKKSPKETATILLSKSAQDQVENSELAKRNFILLKLVPKNNPDSKGASILVHNLKRINHDGLKTYVTGQTALRVDMLDRINAGLPFLMLFIIVVTYGVLLTAFRSVLIPLKAVLMNILSLGASLGIVVIVFQYGWFADELRITSTGYVSIIMPITIFCIVFGISMDYEVFLISRIKEEYEKSGDNSKSTALGLQKTGNLITSAAFILMVVVGSFIFTNIEITKALGVGLFCAIFIDATFIRIIVVPALMKLLGAANWWAPRWVRAK